MNLLTRRNSLVCVCALVFAACETQEQPPPLFNAKDLSVQCPTGQVGWDFSTGGNDTDIVENSVSREITIDSATLGSCNYKDDFAVSCDGKNECTRLAKNSTSPSCSGGALNLTYHCGEEAPRYNVVIPGDASGQMVNLACGEPITILSAVYSSNGPTAANQRNITTAVASACTGRRRCSLDDPYVLNNREDPWPNNHKDTLIRYYCGVDPSIKETTVGSGQRVDLQCPKNEVKPPEFKDTLRVVSVECFGRNPGEQATCATANSTRDATVKDFERRIRLACEGKRYCKVPATPYTSGLISVSMSLTYFCTSPEAPETKLFHNYEAPFVEFYCSTPIQIVNVSGNGAQPEAARAACDHKSACVLPPLQNDGGFGYFSATYSYTCGENGFDVRGKQYGVSSIYSSSARAHVVVGPDPLTRQIQCDAPNNNLFAGIRIASARLGGGDGLLEATRQCYGRDTCFIQTNNSGDTATYRCGSSNATQTAARKSILPAGLILSCRPDVVVKSGVCDLVGSGAPIAEYPTQCIDGTTRSYIAGAVTWCFPGNNGRCEIRLRRLSQNAVAQTIRLKYQCGGDPKEYEYYGQGEKENDFYNLVKLECAVPDQPYVEKACIPESCPVNTRRDAKLGCIPDSTKTAATVFTAPILKEWMSDGDGGTSQWGGAVVTTLREDFPYQVFGYTQYRATGGAQLPPSTQSTLWAYDEFTAIAGAGVPSSQASTLGFRCILSNATLRDAEYSSVTPGYRRVINGGKGAVIPTSCYRQNVDDGRNAWADAARRVGIPESQFRAKYTRQASWVVSAFDPTGKTTAWAYPGRPAVAPNPIGFFYNSTNGWIDQVGFYAQTTDFRFKTQVTFEESNSLELAALSASLRQSLLKVDVANRSLLPTFDVDLTWSQRGDSPARNPLSPNTLLSTNPATPLSRRDLRATIEMARLDATAPNEWIAVNATQFPNRSLGEGNAFSQTVRMTAAFTPALRERALSVRGTESYQTNNGWMRGFEEDLTTFKVRVCMDFNEVSHVLGDTALDDKWVTAARDGTTYRLGFTKRCADAGLVVLERELFIYPTTAVATVETPANSASSSRQGDRAAGSTNDMGNQSGCADTGQTGQSCNGQSRNNMVTGGQFSLSVIQSSTDDQAVQEETTRTTKLSSNMTLFGFRVFDLSGGGNAEPQSSGAWEVNINLTPNLDGIAALIKNRRTVAVKTSAKKVKTKPKAKKGILSKFERDGLAMSLSKEFPFTIGPFPFELEVGFSVGFGFSVGVKIAGDRQSVTSMVNPKYPCLKSTAGNCVIAYSATKGFDDALRDCNYKGGRLAEVRTATDLTEVTGAISTLGSTNRYYWLGGQLAYIYADPRCDTAYSPGCATVSRTRYSWLVGNTSIANQNRLETPLVDPQRFIGNHAFGNNLGELITRVPNKASVLLDKDTSRLATATVATTAPYICTFEPASKYIENSMGIEVKVEFSMGFSASICTPSSKIGFCLTAALNLMTAGVNVSATRSRVVVFNNSNLKVSLLGESRVEGTWEVAFMSGSFSAEIRALLWDRSWEIASYKGLYAVEGDLFAPIVSPYWRKF
ncbi:MAG: hypothetical protein Q8S42_18840 [Archangium sp.]|nr:hypothetical protein [Archangium sp.]